jgi:signal transduction histidine kinase/DNA-binding response OmpR family regulator
MVSIRKPLVLVVDDHIPAVGMLTRLLEREGYEVISAYDGEQALQICKDIIPDLILLDVMMPKLNGFEVLEILRSVERTENIPTILITAKNTPDDIEHGLNIGADDYIAKPFNPRELIARAKSKIDARRLKDELESKTQDLEALLRLSEELKHHLNVNELLELLLYLVLDLLPGEAAILYQIDEKKNIVSSLMSHKDGTLSKPSITMTPIENLLKGQTSSLEWMPEDTNNVEKYSHGILCKLESNGEVHGILGICNTTAYSENHFRLFEGISRQATLAIRNAELYEEKANYATQLEVRVAERTQELQSAHQLLIRSEKLASIGRLSAGIAHEINNPLFPLRINLEHMLEDIEEGLQITKRDVEETLKSVERISRIVRQLLEFTGKDNSNQPNIDSINLNKVIDNVISLSKKYLEHSQVNIDVNLPTLPTVDGNRDQIEQVFLNITLNANAAMPQGGNLKIGGWVDDNEVVLEFSDDGSGIPKAMVDKIFEPFVSTKEDGTGLGLFISYSIIENHQGTIDVTSKIGEGATFTVKLPVTPLQKKNV